MKKYIFVLLCIVLISGCAGKSKTQDMLDLGIKYLNSGDYEAAILEFDQLLEIDSKTTDIYLQISDILINSGYLNKAEDYLKIGFANTNDSKLQNVNKNIKEKKEEIINRLESQENHMIGEVYNFIQPGLVWLDQVDHTYFEEDLKKHKENILSKGGIQSEDENERYSDTEYTMGGKINFENYTYSYYYSYYGGNGLFSEYYTYILGYISEEKGIKIGVNVDSGVQAHTMSISDNLDQNQIVFGYFATADQPYTILIKYIDDKGSIYIDLGMDNIVKNISFNSFDESVSLSYEEKYDLVENFIDYVPKLIEKIELENPIDFNLNSYLSTEEVLRMINNIQEELRANN